ncbi:MAG: MBL fold metallo-hydrolase, partial [Oscillospiraceae bacterium]
LNSMGFDADAPYSGTKYDLATNVCLIRETGKPIEKKSYAAERASNTYTRLVAMGRRLLDVIDHNEGGSNKELARFADQLASLCDKWDR